MCADCVSVSSHAMHANAKTMFVGICNLVWVVKSTALSYEENKYALYGEGNYEFSDGRDMCVYVCV